MSKNKKILHDISKIASAAFSCASTIKRGTTSCMKDSLSKFFSKMNLVKRDEFEAQNKILMQTKKRVDDIAEDIKPEAKPVKTIAKAKPKPKKQPVKKETSVQKKSDKPKAATSSKKPTKKSEAAPIKSKKSVKSPVKKTSKK